MYGSFPPWGKSVEFPANGGGGLKYYKLIHLSKEEKFKAVLYASLIRGYDVTGHYIDTPISFIDGESADWLEDSADFITAIAINVGAKYGVPGDGYVSTLEEALQNIPALVDCEITEEEFYKSPAQFTLMYGDEPKTFFYIEGMTWGEWVNSEYSLSMFVCADGYVLFKSDGSNVVNSTSGRYMECNDAIDNNYTFYLGGGGE